MYLLIVHKVLCQRFSEDGLGGLRVNCQIRYALWIGPAQHAAIHDILPDGVTEVGNGRSTDETLDFDGDLFIALLGSDDHAFSFEIDEHTLPADPDDVVLVSNRPAISERVF